MDRQYRLLLVIELVWLVIAAVLTIAILYPIYQKFPTYPFWVANTVAIVAFLYATRYTFMLKHTFIARQQVMKIVVFFACLPLLFYLISSVNEVQTYIDEEVFRHALIRLAEREQNRLVGYVRTQFIFFGTAGIIATVSLMIRLLISLWRTHNKGTV